MLWFYLVLVNIITLSLATLLQRVLMKEEQSDPFIYTIVFQLTVSVVVAIYAFYKGFQLPSLLPLWPFILLMTVFYAFASVALLNAFKLSEASEVSVISSSRSLWILFVAIPFLNESLTTKKVLGTLLVVLGVVIVSWTGKKFKLKKGHLFALLAAFLFGVAFVNDAFLLHSFSFPSYTVMAFFLPGLFLLLLKPKSIKKMKLFFNFNRLVKMVLLAIFYGTAALAIYASYQAGGEASQIAPISQSSVILTVLLAAIFLNERGRFVNKIAGAIAVFIGVILLK